MDRREFISSAAALAVTGTGISSRQIDLRGLDIFGAEAEPRPLTPDAFALVPPALQAEFDALLIWMRDTGWTAYLQRVSGLDLDPAKPGLRTALGGEVRMASPRPAGFQDFAGEKMLESGAPARSLLYHALASPLVKLRDADGTPAAPGRYPALEQLDTLENYIYALDTHPLPDPGSGDWVLAVFAYEYRPAIKTPHRVHADFVYSRTGIARVGNRPMVWDHEHRSHVNRSDAANATDKDLAVTPARYGVFLARPMAVSEVRRIGQHRRDGKRKFLVPFRKVFTGDPAIGGGRLVFAESHRNEKLFRLTQEETIRLPDGVFDVRRPPFIRVSCTATGPEVDCSTPRHDSDLVRLAPRGSSVLVYSSPEPLVRKAEQDHKRLRFRVPPYSKRDGNRRYTSLKLADESALAPVVSFVAGEQYRNPRNTPMFVNIRHQVRGSDGAELRHLGPGIPNFEDTVRDGGYWAGLFEDSLCDGCVHAVVVPAAGGGPAGGSFAARPVLPAFSVVTAPDFFPMVDGPDLFGMEEHFLAGGPDVLSAGRLQANPHIRLPGTTASAFPAKPVPAHAAHAGTMTAVVSHPAVRQDQPRAGGRSYPGTNMLPDTASNVFQPGWDITYAGGADAGNGVYYATFGLGSPFPEDTKLCAAANGMWPGASPDAARTFQGGLEPVPLANLKMPTAVPLLDRELGYHPDSPAVRLYRQPATRGWDGEQGPFIQALPSGGSPLLANPRRIVVNFTDIHRSDYVANAQTSAQALHAAALRDVTPAELMRRMDALRLCVGRLPGGKFIPMFTHLWLVSAESVADWGAGAEGLGIASDLFAGGKGWATRRARPEISGAGYLYVFARTNGTPSLLSPSQERMTHDCEAVYVCQVTPTRLAYTQFDGSTQGAPTRWLLKNG